MNLSNVHYKKFLLNLLTTKIDIFLYIYKFNIHTKYKMTKTRICTTCQKPKQKGKRLCFNEICKESKVYKDNVKKEQQKLKKLERKKIMIEKNEKKKQEKEKKRIERETNKMVKNTLSDIIKEIIEEEKVNKKKLKVPKAGTSVKGRDGSTRHGMVISVSYYHSPKITVEDVDNRNSLLKIDPGKCFWCKVKDKKDNDHAHPCCNTTDHQYSYTNPLNIVPSCKECNSQKGGKKLKEWINILNWSEGEKQIYIKWLYENKEKLLFNEEDTTYLERQFVFINKIHSIFEYCAKHKLEVGDFIIVNIPDDL